MRAAEHTQPTPWTAVGRRILSADGQELGRMESSADARRIVACVNACAWIPSFILEQGIVGRLVERHAEILEEELPELKKLLDEPYH